MTEAFPVDIGPQYEGDVVRKADLYLEFGGPKAKSKFELVILKTADEVEHERIEVIGPDIFELEEGGSYPLAILIDVAGERLEKETEPVIERRIHMYTNYIQGLYHMNQREDAWVRLSKDAYKMGLKSLRDFGKILIFLYTSELSVIERVAITFITDEKRVQELLPHALEVYHARDDRLKGLREEDVDQFYGCVLCQSFAPTHACIITPERLSLCGAINWFDGRAAYQLDPEGPIFEVPKGELLDPVKGEYSGANQVITERSLGQYNRVYLHSAFEHPHTSCGCFQSICFYIPEVDGFGVVHRDFAGKTPIGASFSTMAGNTGGGRQTEGSLGMALEYMRSPKFMRADGGLYRVMWMPKEIKERYRDVIPEDLYDKIATEENTTNTDELVEFVDKVGHPWLRGEVELP